MPNSDTRTAAPGRGRQAWETPSRLFPRHTVHGTVISLRERRVGDFLPRMIQQQIWERNAHSHDRRRTRTELVLSTSEGTRSWTVRNRRLESQLVVGRQVSITVSPLVGHISAVAGG